MRFRRMVKSILRRPRKLSVARQRVAALFLFVVILAGAVIPTASVYAATREMEQNYPGPIGNSEDSFTPAEQSNLAAAPRGPSTDLTPEPKSEVTTYEDAVRKSQEPADPSKRVELKEERDANKEVFRNSNGSHTVTYHFAPKFYEKDGQWETIDTTLVEDKNAGDSGNIFGMLYGEAQSLADSEQAFKVKENDWQARFGPSDFEAGMVRVEKNGEQVGFTPVGAKRVAPVLGTDEHGRQTINYYDLWPGVNLQYKVHSADIKLDIILKDKDATTSFAFTVHGADLTPHPEVPGAFRITGALGDKFGVAPINLELANTGLVTEAVYKQEYKDGQLQISVQDGYISNLANEAFPVVIDPTVEGGYGEDLIFGGNHKAFKSDGYICSSTCYIDAGSKHDGSAWRQWRSAFNLPYSFLDGDNVTLVDAVLYLNQDTGYSGVRPFDVYHASCLDSFNCVDWGLGGNSSSFDTNGTINVTSIYQGLMTANDFDEWIMLRGEECSCSSWKSFNPNYTAIQFTYSRHPVVPDPYTPSTNPSEEKLIVNTQPTLGVGITTDPDSDIVHYVFRILSTSGTVIYQTDWSQANSVTIPEGLLQDGGSYLWDFAVGDIYGYSPWEPGGKLKVDLRSGKDKAMTYQSVGPVSVGLNNGNVFTEVGSHGIRALAGTIGLNLSYNSPLSSQPGLRASYYNNTTWSGDPALQRTESTVDNDWGTGSPGLNVVEKDYFSAKYEGYFIAPETGTYYFGAFNDDTLKITVNGQEKYNNSGCSGSVCYGSSVSLNAGQAVPFRVDYTEGPGLANARVHVKSPSNTTGEVLPSQWVRTAALPTEQNTGLIGHYYADDGSHDPAQLTTKFMTRQDPSVNARWNALAPVPGMPADDFYVRWEGYYIPKTTGTYKFGVRTDDGGRVSINGTERFSQWADGGEREGYDTTGVSLTAGQPVPIKVEFFEHTGTAMAQLKVKAPNGLEPDVGMVVEPQFLSPGGRFLPAGWTMSADADGGLAYERLEVRQNGDTMLFEADGTSHLFINTGSGFKPPAGEDAYLIRNQDGTYTISDVDSRVYVFNTDGTLKETSVPADDRNPAALKYSYATQNGMPKLTEIADGVDGTRKGTLYYQGDSQCATPPSGFSSPPTANLCAFVTSDGQQTDFFYKNDTNGVGRLAQVRLPGGAAYNLGYESTTGMLATIRDVLANDAVAAGVRTDNATVLTELTYDTLARVTSVTAPAPTSSADRSVYTLDYLPNKSKLHIDGAAEPNGYSQYVEYDDLLRTTKTCDVAALCDETLWHASKDLPLATTDETGLKSTTIYDGDDKPTHQYGPAPSAWFDTDRTPLTTYTSQVPHVETKYDEDIVGPAVAWSHYRNSPVPSTGGTILGIPKIHTTGLIGNGGSNSSPGVINSVWSSDPIASETGMNGWAVALTGKLRLPAAGTYELSFNHTDGLRVWINDKLVIDDWSDGSLRYAPLGTYTHTAGEVLRLRIDYYSKYGTSSPTLVGNLRQVGGFTWTTDWSNYLVPNFGLVTSTKTFDATLGDTTITNNYGSTPELGLAQSSTVDPTGLNLTTSMGYETQGASGSFLRQTSKTIPGGTATSYSYYTATETRDNPCTTGTTETYKQAGFMKFKTEADPDGTGSGSGATPVYRSQNSGSVSSGALTLNKPSGTVNGDLLIMSASADLSASEDVTYTVPSGWTELQALTRSHATNAGNNLQVWYKIASSEPASYAITPDHDNLIGGSIVRIDGQATSGFIHQDEVTASDTGEASVPSVTTTANNTLLLRLATWDQSKTLNSAPSGHTQAYHVDVSGHDNWGGYKEQATAGSTGAGQFDLSGGAPYVGYTVAIAPTSGGGSQTSRVTETVYDDAGRVVATRYNTDSWTCMTYDSRGRVTETAIPAFGSASARTVTNNYAVSSNPLVTSTSDATGTITTTIDLLGRVVSYTDVHGQTTTTTYDDLGRLIGRSGPLGTEAFVYDNLNRLTEQKLDSTTYATVTYDAYSRVQDVTYNQAVGSGGGSGSTPVVQSSNSGSVSSGALTLNKPSGTANGDLLIMTASADLSASEDVTYTIPSGWTQALANTRSDASSAGNNLQVWYKVANNEPASYAITPDHDNLIGGSIMRISGQATSSPIDVSNVTASATGETSAPSVTTTANNTQVLRFATWDQSKTVTAIPSGHTQAYHVDVSGHDNWGGYKEQTTAGSTGVAQFDLSGGAPYVGFTLAVKPTGGTATPLKLTPSRDSLGRVNTHAYTLGDGTTGPSDTITRSQSGQIVSGTELGQSKSYTYDNAGRLTAATIGSNSYAYSFATPSTCSGTYNANAHKNSNRTSQTVNSATTTYCYDNADRLVSSSNAAATSAAYDTHGNTTSLGSSTVTTFTYDSSDRNISVTEGTKSTTYERDALSRLTKRIHVNGSTTTNKYSYTSNTGTPDLLLDSSNNIVEKYLQLPGSVLLTIRSSTEVYSLPNLHGDVMATTDADGALVGTFTYDPFGNPVGTTPNNTATGSTFSWVGQHQKTNETLSTLTPTQMGARVYLPTLGRFLQVDPVEGGTPNNYLYPPNPVNGDDLDGAMCKPNGPNPLDFFSCQYNREFEETSRSTAKFMQNAALIGMGVAATAGVAVVAPTLGPVVATRAASLLWAPATAGSGYANMMQHFGKHGAAVGANSAVGYTLGAVKNIFASKAAGLLKSGARGYATSRKITLTYNGKLTSFSKSKDAVAHIIRNLLN